MLFTRIFHSSVLLSISLGTLWITVWILIFHSEPNKHNPSTIHSEMFKSKCLLFWYDMRKRSLKSDRQSDKIGSIWLSGKYLQKLYYYHYLMNKSQLSEGLRLRWHVYSVRGNFVVVRKKARIIKEFQNLSHDSWYRLEIRDHLSWYGYLVIVYNLPHQ